MAKKSKQTTQANQGPSMEDLGSSQPVQEPIVDKTTKEGINQTGDQTKQEGDQTGAENAQEPKDTGVDKKGKGKTTHSKGVSSTTKSSIEEIAKKLFDRHAIDVLYFTSDLHGFSSYQDASHHANGLTDKAVYEVKRESDGQ